MGGQQPTKEDATAFADLAGIMPSVETHPNAFAWASIVSRFSDAVRGTWPEGGAFAKEGGKKEGKKEKGGKKGGDKKEEKKE